MKLNDLFNEDLTVKWDVFNKVFPEMSTCHHSLRWHMEGSIANHTSLVYDEMRKRIKDVQREDYDEWSLIMLSAALFHDIGKISTTYFDDEQGDWCCKSHGKAGEKLFRKVFFEERLDLREKVAYLIRYHMLLHHTLQKGKVTKEKELIQLMNGLMPIDDMLILHECDCRGSINEENSDDNIKKHIADIQNEVNKLKLKGKDNLWKNVTDKTAKMYVMIGIPGSGKSTYAEALKGSSSIRIVSRDTVRIEMGMCGYGEKCIGTPKQEDEVTKLMKEKIQDYASNGFSFIIDNTSLKRKYRKEYFDYVKKYDIVPIYVYVEAPSLEENFRRRDGEIDSSTIQRMWDGFEFPNRSECYEMWIIDQRAGKVYRL